MEIKIQRVYSEILNQVWQMTVDCKTKKKQTHKKFKKRKTNTYNMYMMTKLYRTTKK